MAADANRWLSDAVTIRDIDRIRPDMAAAGTRINDARATTKAARKIAGEAPSRGDGAHRIVIDDARVVLADILAAEELELREEIPRDLCQSPSPATVQHAAQGRG